MTTEVTLYAPDISCAHCKSSIEGAVAPMDGVSSAEVTIDDHRVDVAYDEAAVDLGRIVATIEDLGYEIDPPVSA
jgi:copper chaperone